MPVLKYYSDLIEIDNLNAEDAEKQLYQFLVDNTTEGENRKIFQEDFQAFHNIYADRSVVAGYVDRLATFKTESGEVAFRSPVVVAFSFDNGEKLVLENGEDYILSRCPRWNRTDENNVIDTKVGVAREILKKQGPQE